MLKFALKIIEIERHFYIAQFFSLVANTVTKYFPFLSWTRCIRQMN